MLALVAYIRFGSLVFLFAALLILCKYKLNALIISPLLSNLIYFLFITIVVMFFFLSVPILVNITHGKLSASVFREDFLQMMANEGSDSTLMAFRKLPMIIRIPLFALYFFFAPFFKFIPFTLGIFNIRNILDMFLTPLILFFCWGYIIQSFLYGIFHNSHIRFFLLIAIMFAVCLGTFSIQARHKTILMPIIYILAGFGRYSPIKKYKLISYSGTFSIILIECIFLFL
jgi:hypothetical protein